MDVSGYPEEVRRAAEAHVGVRCDSMDDARAERHGAHCEVPVNTVVDGVLTDEHLRLDEPWPCGRPVSGMS